MPSKSGLSKWDPGAGKSKSDNSKLFTTTAKDAPDTMDGTNELKPFVGKSGKPPAPYGIQGREF
jgi:hypothetical protein